MIENEDAVRMINTIARHLADVSTQKSNFERLPDTFWGYFARGHDSKGKFGVIVTYSEKGDDVDDLIKMFEKWVSNYKKDESVKDQPIE